MHSGVTGETGHSSWAVRLGAPTECYGGRRCQSSHIAPRNLPKRPQHGDVGRRLVRSGHAGRYDRRTASPHRPRRTGPSTTASATQASAALVSGIRAIPSITHPNEAGHLRPAVKVPVMLSLRGLGDLAGTVSVQMTLSPVAPVTSLLQGRRLAPVTGDLSLTFSSIGMAPPAFRLRMTSGVARSRRISCTPPPRASRRWTSRSTATDTAAGTKTTATSR